MSTNMMPSRPTRAAIATLALSLAVLGSACGDAGATTGGPSTSASSASSASASAKPATTDTSKTATTASAAAAGTGDASDDSDKIADDSASGSQSDTPDVDLSKPDAAPSGPALGASSPPPAPKEGKLTWLDAGSFEIPNPGLKVENEGGLTLMAMPDDKAGLIFRGVKDNAELKTVTADVLKMLKLKDAKFGKPRIVTLGPDKIRAALGGGHVVGKDGKPGKLVFGVIIGTPNVFVLAALPDEASKDDHKLAEAILEHVKKK